MQILLSRYNGTPWKVNFLQGYNLKKMRFGTSVFIVYLIKMAQAIKWQKKL